MSSPSRSSPSRSSPSRSSSASSLLSWTSFRHHKSPPPSLLPGKCVQSADGRDTNAPHSTATLQFAAILQNTAIRHKLHNAAQYCNAAMLQHCKYCTILHFSQWRGTDALHCRELYFTSHVPPNPTFGCDFQVRQGTCKKQRVMIHQTVAVSCEGRDGGWC